VEGYKDEIKTESSNSLVPLHPAIVEALLAWRQQSAYNADTDYVFASPTTGEATAEQQQRPAGLSPTRVDQGGLEAAGLARLASFLSHTVS
jgi:hypothetical protein